MRTAVGRLLAGVAAVGVASVAVAGVACTRGGTGARPTPRPSVTTSPSPSPSPSPSTRAELEAQVIAAVRAYYAELNRALTTGDTTRVRALTDTSCVCMRVIAYVDDTWREGSIRGNEIFLVTSPKVDRLTDVLAEVTVTISGRPYEVLDRAGRVKKSVPAASPNATRVSLALMERWIVSDVAVAR